MTTQEDKKKLIRSLLPYDKSHRGKRLAPHDLVTEECDRTGREVVGVLLVSYSRRAGKEVRAWIYREDYDMILEAYGQTAWTFSPTSNTVVFSGGSGPGRVKTVARFIMLQHCRWVRGPEYELLLVLLCRHGGSYGSPREVL